MTLCVLIFVGLTGPLSAQTEPADAAEGAAHAVSGLPATQPADAADLPPADASVPQASARIIRLTGTVQIAPSDAQGQPGEWRAAVLDETLPPGTRIRTRLRSSVVLAFGDRTAVLIDRATLASIDEFTRSDDAQNVRLGLGHGAVRAGVAGATLRSDMTIATPVATLSKRGTMDFGMEYEPSTGRFRVDLAGEGYVEVFDSRTGQTRGIEVGQEVTEAMLRWADAAVLRRYVPIVDTFGFSYDEDLFNALNDTGLTVVAPGGGWTLYGLDAHAANRTRAIVPQAADLQTALGVLPFVPFLLNDGIADRPEGNFGTGGGRVPILGTSGSR